MVAVDALRRKSKRVQVYNGVAASFLTLFQRIKTGLFQILTVIGLKEYSEDIVVKVSLGRNGIPSVQNHDHHGGEATLP